MAQSSGFFNALSSGGHYDRKYNAEDYSDNLGAIISTGVRRSGDNDLYVQAAGGMNLSVNVGRAWIEGKWYKNDTAFTDFVVPTAPAGDRGRVDRVILRLNSNIEGRLIELMYLTGEVGLNPTAPALTRANGIYDIALADIAVNPNVSQITQSDIYDRRPHTEVCGWITTPVGYDDYFTSLDAQFNDWFDEKRDTLSSVTLFKRYHWSTTTGAETSAVTFNIPQYDPTGVDIVDVYINGLLAVIERDYTLAGSVITFTDAKIVGTDIDVFVYKSIDGTGLGSVSDEITELQEEVSTIKNIGEYLYICNGYDDNVKLSELAQAFLADDSAYEQMTINVYGTFGANAPYAGSGSSVSRYRWFSLGAAGTTKKKVIFDFLNCSKITLNCTSGYYYIGFYGAGVNIKNANVEAICNYVTGGCVMFSATNTAVYAENCRFWITGYSECNIAQTGTFKNCKATVINSQGNSYVFDVSTNGLLRVDGGEYYAYTGNNTYNASVIYIDAAASNAVVITYGMSCPTVAKTSNYQKNAVLCNAGAGAFNDTVTSLTVKASSGQNVRGTYAQSKPDRT